MSLRYGILGFLSSWPETTGYELKKEFDTFMNVFWHSHHSQIYIELNKLEKDGLVFVKEVNQEGKPDKKAYTITQSGMNNLRQWLSTPPEPPNYKDPFLMQTFFMDNIEMDKSIFIMKTHQLHCEERLKKMKSLITERLKLLRKNNLFTHRILMIAIVYRKGIEQEMQNIRWTDQSIALMEKFKSLWSDGTGDDPYMLEGSEISGLKQISIIPFEKVESLVLKYFEDILDDVDIS